MSSKLIVLSNRPNPGFALVAAVAVVLISGCGGGGKSTSPASLNGQLIPAKQLGLTEQRTLHWDNAIDFTFEGLTLPQSVPGTASKTVDEMNGAGFDAGAGEVLVPKGGAPQIKIAVAKFGSTSDAAKARDYLHTIDLQEPCPESCDISPKPGPTFGIPNATSVHQVPATGVKPPPGSGPPQERRVIQFTIGPYLYLADVSADPGAVSAQRWKQGVGLLYAYARKTTPAS